MNKKAINKFITEAMNDFNLSDDRVKSAISQAAWRAVGYTEQSMHSLKERREIKNPHDETEKTYCDFDARERGEQIQKCGLKGREENERHYQFRIRHS